MGHAYAHTWPYMGQPYRESREEGNNREGKGFLGPGKGREGKVIPILFRSVSRTLLPL